MEYLDQFRKKIANTKIIQMDSDIFDLIDKIKSELDYTRLDKYKFKDRVLDDIRNGMYEWLYYLESFGLWAKLYVYRDVEFIDLLFYVITKYDIVSQIEYLIKSCINAHAMYNDKQLNYICMNKLMDRALKYHIIIKDLQNKITNLEHQNELLQTQIDYSPNGAGYKEAEEHFKSLLEK